MAATVLHEEILERVTPKHPRHGEAAAIDLQGGRLLLAQSCFTSGPTDFSEGYISGRTSSDNGRTWSERFVVLPNLAKMNTYNPSFLRLPSGAILLFYFRQDGWNDVKQYVRTSYDEGQMWVEEQCITPDKVRQFMHNDRAVLMKSGRIVLPFAWTPTHTTEAHTYKSLCWTSDDEGKTWHRGSGEISLPERGAMEPVVVERMDGSLLMLIRTQLGHQYRAESFDGGDTWTEARPAFDLVSSEAPANVKRMPGTGDLLIVWNNIFDPFRRHWGRTPLNTAISRDDGETWENVRVLENEPDHSFSYPSIHFQDDEVLLTYYHTLEETAGRELKVKILPVAWFYEPEG